MYAVREAEYLENNNRKWTSLILLVKMKTAVETSLYFYWNNKCQNTPLQLNLIQSPAYSQVYKPLRKWQVFVM